MAVERISLGSFEAVPLPHWHRQTPLSKRAAGQLAHELPGTPVCLDDPDEEQHPDEPLRRLEPLGEVIGAEAAPTHALAYIVLDLDAMGASELCHALQRQELYFGLWAVTERRPGSSLILRCQPSSVRIRRRLTPSRAA